MSDSKCPICKLEKCEIEGVHVLKCKCERCGSFEISDRQFNSMGEKPDFKLSAWVRERYEKGLKIPVIDSKNIEIIKKQFPKYTPREKQTILLQALERKTQYPGDYVRIEKEFNFVLSWSNTEKEFLFYIQALQGRELIWVHDNQSVVYITAKGWDYLDDYSKKIEKKTQAFVAMSFSDDMRSVYEKAIKPAIVEAGYHSQRIDEEPHNERIDVKIMSEIKNSRFVVADFTENNRGVYFEAGYALGLNIPVIWCVKKGDEKKVHFDTRQYNHILWEDEKDLKEKLFYFIDVIIGKAK